VVLIGLETKTRSRDPHPWFLWTLCVFICFNTRCQMMSPLL